MRLPKKPLLALLGLLLVPLLLAGALLLFFWLDTDHQRLKQQLQQWVKQQTGYELLIAGPLNLGLFPELHVKASALQLSGAELSEPLKLEALSVDAEAMALLAGRLEVKSLTLSGLRLVLQRDANGQLLLPFRDTGSRDAGSAEEHQPATAFRLPAKRLRISDSMLSIGGHAQTPALEVSLDELVLQQDANLSAGLNATLNFLIQPAAQRPLLGRAVLSAQLQADAVIEVEQFQADIELSREGRELEMALAGDRLRLTQAGELVQADNWKLVAAEPPMELQLTAKRQQEAVLLSVVIDQLQPAALLAWLGFDLAKLNQGMANPATLAEPGLFRQAQGELQLSLAPGDLKLDISSFEIDQTRLQGLIRHQVNAGQAITNQTGTQQADRLTVQLKIDDIALAPYLDWLAEHLSGEESSEARALDFETTVHVNRLRLPKGEFEPFISQLNYSDDTLHQASGSFRARDVNPADLLHRYPLLTGGVLPDIDPAGQALTRLDGELNYHFEPTFVALSGMDLVLDKTSLTGEFRYEFAKPTVSANLLVGTLDTSIYLPLLTGQFHQDTSESAESVNKLNINNYLEQLRRLQGEGQIQLEQLIHEGTSYRDMQLDFNSATQN